MLDDDAHHTIEINEKAKREQRSLLWQMWHNGGRPLLIAFSFFLASVALLGAAALIYSIRPEATGLGYYEVNREVLNTVPGVAGPAIQERGLLVVRGESCATSRDGSTVQVTVSSSYREIVTGRVIPDLREKTQQRSNGCGTVDRSFQLPPEVSAGASWRYEMIEAFGGEIRFWWSESFRVVP